MSAPVSSARLIYRLATRKRTESQCRPRHEWNYTLSAGALDDASRNGKAVSP